MELKEKIADLKKSDVFLKWRKNDKQSYLVHIFRMFDEENKDIWQFGYYNPEDTITTFFMEKNEIKKIPAQEIFKSDDNKLYELNLNKVKIEFGGALENAKKLHQKKYPAHHILKSFAILQSINGIPTFNITFITQSFCTLNIRIDAESEKIIKEQLTSLIDIEELAKNKQNKQNIQCKDSS